MVSEDHFPTRGETVSVSPTGKDDALAWLSAIVESSHDAIVSKDLTGRILTWNAAAEQLFGYTAAEAVGQHISLIIPEERLQEEPLILARIERGERVDHFETRRRRKDGALIDISLTISPVRNGSGQVIGASKIARDITERRITQEQQRLLLREMSHRVKNLFAVAASLVTLSARSAKSPAEMAYAVRQRLDALTRAHELTRPGLIDDDVAPPDDVSLHQLLTAILSPYDDRAGERIRLEGQEVRLGGAAITSFALIFHEFATNAAKYGALASEQGRVSVTWQIGQGRLHIDWIELGSSARLVAPEHEGFGTYLAARTIAGQFSGEIAYDWRSEGLAISIDLDTDRLGWVGP